ncbi:MAG: MFS transporter [Woeseiaceae bacterium]
MKRAEAIAQPVPFWRKLGWGTGSLGIGLVLNIQTIFFVSYAVDYVGIEPALVGSLILLAKMFDLATDVPMGILSDRTRSRFGRRRPYILAGGLLAAIVFFALFNQPALSGGSLTLSIFAGLLCMAIAYTIFMVPYIAVPSEMTDDSHERSSIMSWRVSFSIAATTGGAFVAGRLIDGFGGGREGFGAMAIGIALVIAICAMVTFFSVPSQPQVTLVATTAPAVSLRDQLRSLLGNRPFTTLLSFKLLQLLSLASNITLQVFFFVNVLGVSFSTYGTLTLWKGLTTILSASFWVALGRRIGKRATAMIATAGQALVNLTWFLAEAGQPLVYSAIRFLFLGFFTSGLIIMGLSMLTDTVDYDRRKTGLRREGVMSGLYTSVEKLAFAIAPALAGIFLQASGYIAGGGGAAVQPDSAIQAIYWLISVVPAALSLLSLLVLWRYRLNDEMLRAA